ncbi:hypothetical protein ACFL0W_06735, partial [Nanoarchaeota archaeon]
MIFSRKKEDSKKGKKTPKKASKEKSKKSPEKAPEKAPGDIPQSLSREEIEEKLEKGHILFRAILQMIGKPKDYVTETCGNFIEKIRADQNDVIVLKEEIAEPVEDQDAFAVIADVELLAKDSSAITFFCFDYMPASIEVLEPSEFVFTAPDFTSFLNDIQGRLHSIDMMLKSFKLENENLRRNAAALLRNNIMITLLHKGSSNLADLSKAVGIPGKQLEPFL